MSVSKMEEGEGRLTPLAHEQTLTQRAYDAVRRGILAGDLENGELYSVQTLATMLDVSRTPVREALLQLERDGAVRFERNRGVRVTTALPHDIEEVFVVRLLLEVPATYSATEANPAGLVADLGSELSGMIAAAKRDDDAAMWRHDQLFHGTLLKASGVTRLVEFVAAQRDFVVRRIVTTEPSRTLEDIAMAHEPIVRAVKAHDPSTAAEEMWRHIHDTAILLLEQHHAPTEGFERWASLMRAAVAGSRQS